MKLSYSWLFMALAVLLAALLAALWLLPGPPQHWRTWHTPAPQPPDLNTLGALLTPNPAAKSAYPEVTGRPLFSTNRRPVADAPDAAGKPLTPIDQARLLGIVAGMGVNGVMIEYDGQSRFVQQGDSVGEWRLTGTHDRTASFERGGQQRDLQLPLVSPADSKASAPAAPATGPAPTANPVPTASPAPASASTRASASATSLASTPASAPTTSRASTPAPASAPAPATPRAAVSPAVSPAPAARGSFGGSRVMASPAAGGVSP